MPGTSETPDPGTEPQPETPPPDTDKGTDTGPATSAADDTALGDAGKRALEKERRAARDASKKAAALEQQLEELRTAQLSDTEKAVAEARAAGRAEALAEANTALVEARATAAAAGKLRDPELAAALLGDLAQYVGDDGAIDGERIASDLDELVEAKPYLGVEVTPPATGDKETPPPPPTGTVPGGAQGSAPTKFKRSQLRDPAFYAANKEAILAAAREGRIEDDG